LVGWSLTSLVSTNTAISQTKYHGKQAFLVICCLHHTKGSAAEIL